MIKVPRGEDPRAEVPRWGGEGRGKRRKRGGRVLAFVVLVHAALIFRAYLACTGTVFPRINAAAFIKFFMIWVRRLFEGGVYLK